MRNIRLVVAYEGTDFRGWQRQPQGPTVQSCLEDGLQKLTGAPVTILGSGRTDAGVHALRQVANFHTESTIPCENLVKALNNHLPPTIRIRRAEDVALTFHARYDVRCKTYCYRILVAPICPPFLWRYVWHYPYALDWRRMAEAAQHFQGEHDFASFAAADDSADDSAKTKDRVIIRSCLVWRPRTSVLAYEVTGTGFLRYMVRNIVGTLVEVGRGKLAPGDIPRILVARDRVQAGPTAPAQGLCLVRVEY